MSNSYQVFHSSCDFLRQRVHVVLVRPELGANVGSCARAIANMGIQGSFRIVGDRRIIDSQARRLAKHAGERLDAIQYFPTLADALKFPEGTPVVSLATASKVGSPHRPHPMRAKEAVSRAMSKLNAGEIRELVLVFGPEGDGLTNADIDQCDWIATIPTSDEYPSLNLAQAVLIFSYEVNQYLLEEWRPLQNERLSQKEKLVAHLVRLAEAVGFILPGDPFKMRPRLEEIFGRLPNHIPEAKTLHGLLDQTIRSVLKGAPDMKGRYRYELNRNSGVTNGNQS